MKKLSIISVMALLLVGLNSCNNKSDEFEWTIDKFDDISVLRYQVPGFEELSLNEKIFIYYLNEAALCGRDIIFDQNCKYNLPIRRTLEAVYTNYQGDRNSDEFKAFEQYLKKVWFANGIHHHYSGDKFIPAFSQEFFTEAVKAVDASLLPAEYGDVEALLATLNPVIFDPAVMPKRLNQDANVDMLTTSACNYYEGVTQAEAEKFYADMADPKDPTPISYGLNSKLIKENGKIYEQTYKLGGMYSEAIEKIIFYLDKALPYASEAQKPILETLISYYKSGDLREFDKFNILWAADTTSRVDFINYFTEVYGDPLGYKAAWESIVNFKDMEATKRTTILSDNAQWFEDNSPIDDKFKKKTVKGVSAKVITVSMLGGECYPATPIGINLPNADWIRKDYGSKSVTIQNITHAYAMAAQGNGFSEEFILKPETRELKAKYGALADNLHTDLHECLGHGSGQLGEGVKGDELRSYASTLEETRADLFALYYLYDQKLVDLGILPCLDAGRTEYDKYIMNGMMTQFTRIKLGDNVEEAHMRNRKLIAEWCYEHGQADNVIEKVVVDGKTYIVVNDYDKLRELFGTLLREVQRIKSEGDYDACKSLIEKYAVKIDPELHKEVLERYAKLNVQPYSGFVNPVYTPVMENDQIVDIKIEYTEGYVDQMLNYSANYSFLPNKN